MAGGMIASKALGIAGGIGGMVTGLKGAKEMKKIAEKQMKQQAAIHEEGSATRKMLSEMVQGQVGLAEQNLLAGETARADVFSSLGQPGTYDMPSQTPGPISFEGIRPTGLGFVRPGETGGGMFTGNKYRDVGMVTGDDVRLGKKKAFKGVRPWEVEGELLDPKKMAAQVKSSSGFRQVSRMVVEAEQLMNRQGPLWDQMNNSIVGSVYESNAAFQRDAMQKMSKALARGGTARRMGMQMAQAFQVQEGVNRQRTEALWQSKMQLEEFRTEYAQNVQGFAQAWVNNSAGIRDGFTNALQNLQLFWATTMAPTLASATVGAQSATQQGVLDASQGLMEAQQKKTDVIQSGIQSITGSGQSMLGSIGKMGGGSASGTA